LGENPLEERMGQSLGDFLADSFAFVSQARLRAQDELEAKVREEMKAKAKEELARQAQAFSHCETALTQEQSCLRQSEKDLKKRFFDKGQAYIDLESKVPPLRTKAVELEGKAKATKAKMAKLEERATDREVHLGRVEAELTQQAKAFKKTEAKPIEDTAGFEDALA